MSLRKEKQEEKIKNSKRLIKKVKKQVKGITLIALVITIIVLLILAGIALNLTIGQNGIFSRAEIAANTWRNAETNEQLAMGKLEDLIGEAMGEAKEGTLAWMYEQAEKEGCTNDDGICDNPNHLHIGDYVNFENQVIEYLESDEVPSHKIEVEVASSDTGMSETQHFTVNSSTNQVKWRVLGYDSQKKEVKLKAELPLQTSDEGSEGMLYLCGAEAYLYAPDRLDSIAKEIYGGIDIVTEARSMKIDDINTLFCISEEEIKSKDVMPTMNRSSYEYGDSLSSITGVTPDDFMNYLNEIKETHPEVACSEEYTVGLRTDFTSKYSKPLTNETVTGYAYMINDGSMEIPPESASNPMIEMIINPSSTIYDLLFKDATYETSGAYWLSSSGVREFDGGGDASFGPGMVCVAWRYEPHWLHPRHVPLVRRNA